MNTTFKQNKSIKFLALLPLLFILIFVVTPVANIFITSLEFDSLQILRSSTTATVIWFTTWQALLSTGLALALALPIAAICANFKFRSQRLIISLVTVPFILPSVVVGAAFLQILPSTWHRTALALIVAHAYFNFGFAARLISTRWVQIHPHLDDAARTLGATPIQVFTSVTFKLLRPVISSAALLVFTLCFTSYGVVRILGGLTRSTIETEIYFRAMQLGDVSGALLLSIVQIVVISAIFSWASWSNRNIDLRPLTSTVSRQKPLQHRSHKALVTIVGVFATAIAIAPMIVIFTASLTTSVTTSSRFSISAWRSVFSQTDLLQSLLKSFTYVAISAVLATFLGLLAASSIAYGGKKFRVLSALTSLPIVISAVSIGLGIIVTFDTAPFDWRGAQLMLPIAHALVALPLAMRIISSVLNDLPDSLRQASTVLGATNWQTWKLIDLKIIRRSIFAAASVSAAVSLGEFGASSFLVRRGAETLPIKISQLLSRPSNIFQSQAYALSGLLIIFSLVIIFVIDKLNETIKIEKHHA